MSTQQPSSSAQSCRCSCVSNITTWRAAFPGSRRQFRSCSQNGGTVFCCTVLAARHHQPPRRGNLRRRRLPRRRELIINHGWQGLRWTAIVQVSNGRRFYGVPESECRRRFSSRNGLPPRTWATVARQLADQSTCCRSIWTATTTGSGRRSTASFRVVVIEFNNAADRNEASLSLISGFPLDFSGHYSCGASLPAW